MSVDEKVENVFCEVMQIPRAELPVPATMESLSDWSSLRHAELMIALQKQFGVRFRVDELQCMITLDLIKSVVSSKLARP